MTKHTLVASMAVNARQRIARGGRDLGINLHSGMCLTLPLPLRRGQIAATLGQLLALLGLLWLLSLGDDLLAAGLPARFSPWGLLSWTAMNYLWLTTLAVIVVTARLSGGFLRLAVPMAAVLVVQFTVWSAAKNLAGTFDFGAFDNHYMTWWIAFFAWEVLVFARILFAVCDVRLRSLPFYTAFYACAVYGVLTTLPHNPIFVEPWTPSTSERPDVEAIYYAQPNLIGQSLYALSPQRPGTVDAYFVGFAAYSDQDVFKREIEQATVIFEQQFDAIGRTLPLINHLNTVQTVPLANRHNLDRAIQGLAQRIDRSEDIVVLFLSSHGDDDATISVELGEFGFNDLSAREVREILDKHAIEWRVVIVSACYSGSFIDALASPRTLVITAAASDRSSFGCSHDNEWTYFGEAYFAHALTRASGFVEAFDIAAERIRQRESAEGKKPSMPQISVGDEIAEYLRAVAL